MLRLVLVGLMAFAGASSMALAQAAPDEADARADEEARMRFQLGQRYFAEGRFEEAAVEFQLAYDSSPRDELLYNVYLAHRDGGNLEGAALALRTLLEGGYFNEDDRPRNEARLRALEREIAERESSPGPDEGEPDEGEPEVESAPTQISADGNRFGVAPWIVGGLGGALLVGSVITGVVALGKRSDLDSLCPTQDTCSGDWEPIRDSGQTMALLTDVFWVVGGAAVITGLVLGLVGRGRAAEDSPRVGLGCTGQGCSASLRGAF